MVINKFALFLVLGAAVTGFFWLIYKVKFQKDHQAAISQNEEPKRVHMWFDGIGGLFPVIALVLIFRSFLFEPFQIPSGSMMRTLLVGDFLLVNKFTYGLKNPVTNASWIDIGEPKRGEIIVFKAPKEPEKDFIKRVIGLPGDTVIYNYSTKELSIKTNCTVAEAADSNACQSLTVSYSKAIPSQFFAVDRSDKILPVEAGAPDPEGIEGIRLLERTETIDGRSHTILINPSRSDNASLYEQSKFAAEYTRQFTVPEGQYFVLGDNRDHSSDGRFFGMVPKENLVGRAVFIWISFERQPNEWPAGIRFNRIGMIE